MSLAKIAKIAKAGKGFSSSESENKFFPFFLGVLGDLAERYSGSDFRFRKQPGDLHTSGSSQGFRATSRTGS
jgi:hypothetical protein